MKKIILFSMVLVLSAAASKTASVSESVDFFGSNPVFVKLLEDGLAVQKEMQKSKESYLALYETQQRQSGLEARISAEKALNADRDGFEAGLNWQLFSNGYFGSQQEAKRKRSQKALMYSKDMQNILARYSKVAAYEIEDIKKSISYYYTVQKEDLLHRLYTLSQKKLRRGLLTKSTFVKIDTRYRQSSKDLHYLSSQHKEKFDSRYKALISSIEKTRILDLDTILKVSLKDSPAMQSEKEKARLLDLEENWAEEIRGKLYVKRKEYTFIDRKETVAGFQLDIPLDYFGGKDELAKLERQKFERMKKSIELLFRKEIGKIYENIVYHKNAIEKVHEEVHYLQTLMEQIEHKKRNPLPVESRDFTTQKLFTEVRLIEADENIWLHRCDILIALIKLQYLTGIKIL